MSTDMMSPDCLLQSFVLNNDKVGNVTFERFIDVVHAYLNTDFKFDYITRCEFKMRAQGLPDLVIHKLDITYLIDGKTLVQIYNTNIDSKPIDVLKYIRSLIVDLINNTFFPNESILVNLSRQIAISEAEIKKHREDGYDKIPNTDNNDVSDTDGDCVCIDEVTNDNHEG